MMVVFCVVWALNEQRELNATLPVCGVFAAFDELFVLGFLQHVSIARNSYTNSDPLVVEKLVLVVTARRMSRMFVRPMIATPEGSQ